MSKATLRLWAAIVFIAAALEARGLLRKGKADTLSEYTWGKTKRPAMRAAIGGLMGWLVYHFTYGADVPLGAWDLVTALGGMVVGLTAARRKRGGPDAP